jgi:hypothetical protein
MLNGARERTWRLSLILSHTAELTSAESDDTRELQIAVVSPLWAIYDSFKDSQAQRTANELMR